MRLHLSNRPLPRCAALALLLCFAAAAIGQTTPSPIPSPGNPIWAAQVALTQANGSPWTAAGFEPLAQDGINRVEINLNWGDIEPQKGHFDFRALDSALAAASRNHLKVYPIFWESVWGEKQGKNPPRWLTARDVTSDGVTASEPPWWDPQSKQDYFNYVVRTIRHIKSNPGFGGLFVNYGWLDAMWGPAPKDSHGVTGYAPADQRAFHRWLPKRYKTLAAFNRRWHTSYAKWSSVPAAKPGEPLFAVYQAFRHASVFALYSELSQLVRSNTHAPIFYYWGGAIGGRGGPAVLGNDPDTFFKLARRYHATVVLDDANHPALPLLFGNLAQSYHVPLLQEWTPTDHDLKAEAAQWLGHFAFGAPFEVGEDFFIYPPPNRPGFADAWKLYADSHHKLAKVHGRDIRQPVAVWVPTLGIAAGTDLDGFHNMSREIANLWLQDRILPTFITGPEVESGLVHLDHYQAIAVIGGKAFTGRQQLRNYAAHHPVFKNLHSLSSNLDLYVTLTPKSSTIEVVPTLDRSSLWLVLSNPSSQNYSGVINFHPQTLGIAAKATRVINSATGKSVPMSSAHAGSIRWNLKLSPAALEIFKIKLDTQAKSNSASPASPGK